MTDLSSLHAYLGGPALLAALVALGMLAGLATGLFGVGGAFIITPLLNMLLGIDYTLAVGSSLSFTIGATAAGWRKNLRLKRVACKSMAILAGGAICGTAIGYELHNFLRQWTGGGQRFELAMHGMFVVVLLVTAYLVAVDVRGHPARPLLQRLPIGPKIDIKTAGIKGISLPAFSMLGTIVGVFSGLLGIGGGVLFMPVLLLAVGMNIHHAVGTSLGVVLFSALAGATLFGVDGQASLWIVLPLLAGSAVGVQLGVAVAQRIPGKNLRRSFVYFVPVIVAMIIMDALRKLTRGG